MLTEEEETEMASCNGDLMEEMEKILTKLEHINACYTDPALVKKSLPISSSQSDLGNDFQPTVIKNLVEEISDLIHAQIH